MFSFVFVGDYMDKRRLIIFIVLSLGLLLLWEKYNPEKPIQPQNTVTASASNNQAASSNVPNTSITDTSSKLVSDKVITVTTDTIQAQINTVGGDLRSLDLIKHGSDANSKEPYQLLTSTDNRVFIAQTGLVSNSNIAGLPTHNSIFSSSQYNYTLEPKQDTIIVNLTSKANPDVLNGIDVIKTYTFKRGSYIVDVGYQIVNNTDQVLNGISAYWRLLRDETAPTSDSKFVHTYTGAAYYTNSSKFNKVSFSDINKGDINYPQTIENGWVGFIQHYFTTMWLLNAYNYPQLCGNASNSGVNNGIGCRFSFKAVGNLTSAGLLTDLPAVKPHSSYAVAVPLFAGPEAYDVLASSAPELERTKDYGWVYIFATPLFWLLVKLYDLVHNWGWAIISLTIVVKMVLYPLTRASYISMGKMKALSPKMEQLKKQYGNDKVKMQQEVMALYRSEKVNPIGGCLPMILQIPVFIGLYWALLSSVELRQASFLWMSDLSIPDPYFILPACLAILMFLQTFLSPPPSDPMQAKMMRIMPVAFSVMFFFFPAGLVVYWLVNQLLSMLQQWYVNHHVTLRRQNRERAHHSRHDAK